MNMEFCQQSQRFISFQIQNTDVLTINKPKFLESNKKPNLAKN